MNGFCVFILLSYVFCSFKSTRDKKLYASDFLRVGMIYLFNYSGNLSVISSSGFDLLALGLVFYIMIKWVSYLEENVKNLDAYACLCLLGVYAVSVKLSAAMKVLLTIMPAVGLIRKKEWKDVIKYIVIGIVIILPFLIRNVIISGYLIYPYPEIDLFNADWNYMNIIVTSIACFGMWFIGSPLTRYGSAFLLLIPLYVIGEIVCGYVHKYSSIITICIVIIVCGNMFPMVQYSIERPATGMKESSEYEDLECVTQMLGNQKIYVPVETDKAGYHDFPSTPYSKRLAIIELRGDELYEGFRIKEYKDKSISTYGNVYDTNVFKESK